MSKPEQNKTNPGVGHVVELFSLVSQLRDRMLDRLKRIL